MDQTGIGGKDDSVAGFPGLHAEHDIAEGETETLVESAEPLENVAAHHLARAGDRQIVSVTFTRAEHPGSTLRRPRENVPDKAQPEHHAGMLNRPIRIQELGSHDSNLR